MKLFCYHNYNCIKVDNWNYCPNYPYNQDGWTVIYKCIKCQKEIIKSGGMPTTNFTTKDFKDFRKFEIWFKNCKNK